MKIRSQFRGKALLAVLFALVLAGVAAGSFAADPPVTVTVALSGDTNPGGTATAKATVKVNDGSTLQSISWKQTGGVPATLSGTTTDTVTVVLPSLAVFKKDLMEVLEESPIPASSYPKYVPVPVKFEGGLQNRFVVVGITPHGLTDAAGVKLEVSVVTSSGVYKGTTTVAAKLPWAPTVGQRNVAIGVPVLLHGKTPAAGPRASYDWKLTVPATSTATLKDAATQDPEFVPDIAGTYQLSVTDTETNKPVNITVHAGTWKGVITGTEANGQPKVDTACTSCHVKGTPHFDMFTPWQRSGHAHILSSNIDNPAGHWTTGCIDCHSVGHNESASAKNNGVDDQADYAAFTSASFITVGHGAIGNWAKVLSQMPASARLMNIQCENCHGPNDSAAHMKKDDSRTSLSSDMCGSCHGEPPRHGRFQQWQISKHAGYGETLSAEGINPGCAKCHSAQGFVQWAGNGFSTTAIKVDWTAEDVHPVTCQTCHDPHDVGSVSGDANNATVRLMGDTPMLDAGFKATGVGKAALCMSCHNGRRGLKNDTTFDGTNLSRAPHVGPQADVVMGQNLYFVKTGTVGFHGMVEDSCVTCHMTSTPQPAALSLGGGSNHTFYASPDICSKCHTEIKAEDVQHGVEVKAEALKASIEAALKNTMAAQIRFGNFIDFGAGKTIKSAADIKSVELIESHGAQGVTVTLADGTKYADYSLASVKVVRPTGTSAELLATADPTVAKAGWNYFMVESDKSKGVHNPAFVNSALDVTLFAINAVNTNFTTPTAPGGVAAPAIGGGIGNGAGAVSCTTPYVYWAEIAGHMPGGNDSQWRTDLVARNLGTATANLRFVLHQSTGNLEGTATINGFSQRAFEDIVASTLGSQNGMGSLEICSNQPLLVNGRIFNQAPAGTFGQNLEGRVADLGYSAGQTISLIGLRQKTNAFRSNLSVTNGGKTDAQVTVNLFDATGKSVKAYDLTVPAGQVVQDTAPFANRAGQPDIDWGFATITVVKGTNIITSASLIDMKTNDPTTIFGKQ